MSTDYKKIAEDNIKKYGTDISRYGPVLLTRLYSDRTHFIYEILQNAEDAGAKKINFHLFENRLEVRHNGRLFDSADVQGICGLVEGTKKDDLTQIGKFGIGFKSVYAYTKSPQIYSDKEAFCIKDYVLPQSIVKLTLPDNETLFIFPFNHDDVLPDEAFKEIAKRLLDIGTRTLLFLNNIEEIVWCIDGQESGNYIREVHPENNYNKTYIVAKIGNAPVEDEEWLVIRKPLKLNNTGLKVEVAFKIDNGTIVPAKDSKLIVFFPTEKPTYLNFLIQGPYRTTPNRENIPLEDNQNLIIIKETAELVSQSIPLVKKLGLLDVNFLNVLPINADLREGEPIYDELFNTAKNTLLDNEELLPTHNGNFTKVSEALLTRSKELTEFLTDNDINLLFLKKNWLDTRITYDRTRELRDYLTKELQIREVDFGDFAGKISADFFALKSDAWMADFYNRMLGQPALWAEKTYSRKEGVLRLKPIIRLEDGSHVAPYNKYGNIQVYLPTEFKSKYNTVKKTLINDESSLKFLKELGLTKPDLFAEINEKILPKYQKGVEIGEEEYFEDFEKILTFFNETDSTKKKEKLISKLSDIAFILSKECDVKISGEIYLNTPDLERYFEGHDPIYFVSEKLYERFEGKNLVDLLMQTGVQNIPRRKKFSPNLSSEEKSRLRNNSYSTQDVDQYDYDLEGLDNFLHKELNLERSLVLWNLILKSIKSLNNWDARSFFDGSYSWKYYSVYSKKFDSIFLKKLHKTCWVVDKEGTLKKTSEITFSELADEYLKEAPNIDALKEKLRFKPDAFDQLPSETKDKLKLTKDYSSEEVREALILLDKKRNSEQSKEEQGQDDWAAECEAGEIEVDIKDISPVLVESPSLEGQIESLIGNSNEDNEGSQKKGDEKKKLSSSQAKEIGKWGEEYVFNAMKNRFIESGKIDETDFGFILKNDKGELIEVYWLNMKSDKGKGYDFVVRVNGIESEYIEVKSKVDRNPQLIEITGTQWEFARELYDKGYGNKYWIYIVENAGKAEAKIMRFNNPVKLWKDGKLYAHPVHFKL